MSLTFTLPKIVLLTIMSQSGVNFSDKSTNELSNQQAIAIISSLVDQPGRQDLQKILSVDSEQDLSTEQMQRLDEIILEAVEKLDIHEKPFN